MVKGKVAVVTGSTSGIGLGIATALANNGAHVVLNGLGDEGTIAKAKSQVAGAGGGGKVLYHPADMTKPAEIADLVDFAVRELGSVDILVNNAGIQHTARVENFPAEKWEAIIAINLSSAFYATRAALPHMQKKQWGRIINIASVHGLVSSIEKAAYCSAKHGLMGLTKVIALENAKKGISCNAICPGWVETPLVVAQIEKRAADQKIPIDQARRDLLSEKQPTEDFVSIDQLASAVIFLCNEAGMAMTGAPFIMDGGWQAR